MEQLIKLKKEIEKSPVLARFLKTVRGGLCHVAKKCDKNHT